MRKMNLISAYNFALINKTLNKISDYNRYANVHKQPVHYHIGPLIVNECKKNLIKIEELWLHDTIYHMKVKFMCKQLKDIKIHYLEIFDKISQGLVEPKIIKLVIHTPYPVIQPI